MVISLDIPSLDGHLAALEMREHGGEARIVFVAPRRLATVAADAKFSAGAVAWLQKPITNAVIDEQWTTILGSIPEAPGLADLDQLYPIDRIKPEEDDGPLPLPALPGLPLPGMAELPTPGELPALEVELPSPSQATSGKKRGSRLVFTLITISIALGVVYYASTMI